MKKRLLFCWNEVILFLGGKLQCQFFSVVIFLMNLKISKILYIDVFYVFYPAQMECVDFCMLIFGINPKILVEFI